MSDISGAADSPFREESVSSLLEGLLDRTVVDTEVSFLIILEFLADNPEMAPKPRNSDIDFESEKYLSWLKKKFIKGREIKSVSTPSTFSDPVVSDIMSLYFGVTEEQITEAILWHRQAMAAENILGTLLETYIAEVLESEGWVWCSGSTVKSVDFIRPTQNSWVGIQIKNRDNSENSSSASVRDGTTIEKWHRLSSKTGETHWERLNEYIAPDFCGLSESEFRKFALNYIGGE